MKTFSDYILEKQNFIFGGKSGLTGKEYDRKYKYFPKDGGELYDLVRSLFGKKGYDADFNDIDVSKVEDMQYVFHRAHDFNGDISEWDTSSATDMEAMFYDAHHFNGDISDWDTSNVTNMNSMFYDAPRFNQDISRWDTSKVEDMGYMFAYAKSFNQDISRWDVSMVYYEHDIPVHMFDNCPIKEDFKPKF